MPSYDLYKVTFHAEGIAAVSAFLDETPVQITGGYGGWTVTSRQRRTGLTMWMGKDPIRMSVPVLFDGYSDMDGQEVNISRLSRMALPPTGQIEPPTVQVTGRGIPHPGPKNWVIENLQWGTNVIWDHDVNGSIVRLRQDCVVNLMQYVAGDRQAFSGLNPAKSSGSKAKPGSKGFQKPVKVKAGDSLSKIANRVYKNPKPGDWKLIAKANNIKDPRSIKPGQTLKIPKK
jgi:hypothetical protein